MDKETPNLLSRNELLQMHLAEGGTVEQWNAYEEEYRQRIAAQARQREAAGYNDRSCTAEFYHDSTGKMTMRDHGPSVVEWLEEMRNLGTEQFFLTLHYEGRWDMYKIVRLPDAPEAA